MKLWAHVVAGAVVLGVASLFAGFEGYFFIDEAAVYAQLDVLDMRGQWTIPRPFPDADADGSAVPMARSDLAGDRYAPFAKHPTHVVLARGADLMGGEVGVRLLSSLAVLAAGIAAALLSADAPGRRAVAFWTTIAASPLLFHANLVVAHGLAAAVAGLLFVVVSRRPVAARWVVGATALTLLGGLLRTEFVLLALAGAIALAWSAIRRRSGGDAALAVAMATGGVAAFLLDPWLRRMAIGGGPGVAGVPGAGTSAGDVVEAVSRSLFEVQGSAATTLGSVGVVLCTAASAAAVVLVTRRSADRGLTTIAGVIALLGASAFVIEPHVVTGLLWAFPALLVLAAIVTPGGRIEVGDSIPLVSAALFALLVGATQYSVGGGVEWGWRYVAIAIPLVTPTIAAVATELWDRRHRSTAALGLAAAAVVLVQIGGLRVQRDAIGESAAFLERAAALAAASDVDWIVSLDASFGRFAYPLSIEQHVATVTPEGAGPVFGRLLDLRADRILVVWRSSGELPLEDLDAYAVAEPISSIGSGYRTTVLEHRGT